MKGTEQRYGAGERKQKKMKIHEERKTTKLTVKKQKKRIYKASVVM
jgi:hypothetical protein